MAATTTLERPTSAATASTAVAPTAQESADLALDRAMFTAAQAGDPAAIGEVLERYTPLLRTFAWRYGRISGVVEQEDLVAVAQAELIMRLRTLDLDQIDHPMGYLTPRVRGAMIDHLRSNDTRPRSVRKRRRQLRDAQAELEQTAGYRGGLNEAASSIGMDADELAYCSREIGEVTLESLARDEGSGFDPAIDGDFGDDLAARELAGQMMQRLKGRDRFVVEEVVLKGRLMHEVAAELGVTESRVSQIKRRALDGLRTWHDAHHG